MSLPFMQIGQHCPGGVKRISPSSHTGLKQRTRLQSTGSFCTLSSAVAVGKICRERVPLDIGTKYSPNATRRTNEKNLQHMVLNSDCESDSCCFLCWCVCYAAFIKISKDFFCAAIEPNVFSQLHHNHL